MHKPTAEECRIIRDAARKEAGSARIRVEAGKRVALIEGDLQERINLNVRLLVDGDGLDGTDLFDQVDWASFRKDGFQFAKGGRALIDFYVSTTGDWGELEGNVDAYWEGGRLVRIKGTGGVELWRAD